MRCYFQEVYQGSDGSVNTEVVQLKDILRHRPYIQNDLETICSFPQDEKELFYFYPKAKYPLTPEHFQNTIDQRSDPTVVENNGKVVGFANFYQWKNGICNIGNVLVAPLERGKGVAKYLIKTMISLAQSKHAASVVNVACFNHNTAGLLLYKKLGFEPFDIEERQTQDGNRVALIHMRYQVTKTKFQDIQ